MTQSQPGTKAMTIARAIAAATTAATSPPLPGMLPSRGSPLRLPSLSGTVVVKATWEEALIEMYLTSVSVRRVEGITEALWGSKKYM